MSKKQLQVAIAGFGLSGRYFHAPFLKASPEKFLVKKVMSRRVAEVHLYDPTIEVVSDFEALCGSDIDVVFVCTPNEMHFQNAKIALEAGKNVVIEKPFALNTQQADSLINIAQANDLRLTAYQNRRWDADFLTIKRLMDDNLLGEIIDYEARFDRFRPDVPHGTWKEVPKEGAGNLYNLAPHLADQALALFGTPKSVSATIRTVRAGALTDDYFEIRMEYRNKHISLKSSLLVYEHSLRYAIHGTKGSFFKTGMDVQENDLRANKLPTTEGWGVEPACQYGTLHTEDYVGAYPSEVGNYAPFYDNLYEAIVHNAPLEIAPRNVWNTTRVIDLAIESNRLGQSLRF